MTTNNDTSAALDLDATMAAVDYLRPVAPETARHADALVAEVLRLRAAVAAARREGAEAMREACAQRAAARLAGLGIGPRDGGNDVAAALRALPLPEGES